MEYIIEDMKYNHWESVSKIYLDGIKTGISTFQSELPNWEEWDSANLKSCRLVAVYNDQVIGWVALRSTSNRIVYSGVAEISIYVCSKYRGLGVGKKLLESVIKASEQVGIWTLQSTIIKENIGSLSLHRSVGFREVGYREKLGRMKDGRWHDVYLMEKRSEKII
ncbi:GNAT family N-acetyltransferase [Clostridium grantii]|uniref:Phosphinothricin acetyltransferase n=1 Tax=Clostridium grantii DSM 8605 TaxID=1121316 RepID=A0A1M5VQV4_9CLOT|nr:GNAT family N-acetyltransferase [Clostridium grantii]SHH77313.1 phosphinothricin acetyltransferase [Clostridium grantii DSM 8605]